MTDLNIYITEEARTSETEGILSGRDVAVKDNLAVQGMRTTCGSKMLKDYVPSYNATVIENLLDEGARITGKTNMDEFAMGTTTETSAFGPTKNPVDTDYVPGGSSGGSAAAVASGEVNLALGSDTGGSVRCPASFTGVYGLKPTYGLVSRNGIVAYSNSLEQVGPIADSIHGISLLLKAIAGLDQRDHTTVRSQVDDYRAFCEEPNTYSLGIPEQLVDGVEQSVKDDFWSAVKTLESEGFTYEMITMPSLDTAVEAYYVIAMSEAASNLARFDGVRFGSRSESGKNWNDNFSEARGEFFGSEVKRRIMLGTYTTSKGYEGNYYSKSQKIRTMIQKEFRDRFQSVDLILTPTMPVKPFKIGESLDDPMKMYLADANTTPVNLANLPAISAPANQGNNLPTGLQLIGPKFSEPDLIRASKILENQL